MKNVLIRNAVYTSNNNSAAKAVLNILEERKLSYDEMVESIETALNAAEYKGKAKPFYLQKAIDYTWKVLRG